MEGYWLTHFVAGNAQGDGVAMMQGGELVGGDLDHLWTGTFEEEGSRVFVRIRIVPCVSRIEEETMTRERPLIVSLQGYCTDHFARLHGHPDQQENLLFQVTMRKCRAAVPRREAAQTEVLSV